MKDNPDGSWVCSVKHDRKQMRRASAMMRAVHKEESERGKEVKAAIEKERVTMPDGTQREIYGHLLDGMRRKVKKGMRGVGKNGKGPTEFFGLSDSYGKYEQGPDGLWFVWNDGWEPTSLWRNGAQSPQHDPAGNVWVEQDGEWDIA